MTSFNILLVGPGNVGVTSFLDIFSQMKKTKNNSIIYNPIIVETEKKEIVLNMYESTPMDLYETNIKSDALIFMLDLTNKNSILNIEEYIQNYENIYGTDNPIIILGNKYDDKNVQIFQDDINLFFNKIKPGRNIHYSNISCKKKYNIDNPFDLLLNHLTNNENTKIKYIGKHLINSDENEDDNIEDDILIELLSKLNTFGNNQNIDNFGNVIEMNYNAFNFSK